MKMILCRAIWCGYSGHIGNYVEGQVIHSPQEGEVVKISNMHMMSIITIRRFID